MSDPALDALAEAARNRGLKLIRSRVRTQGKPGYGKVGVAHPDGTPVFGLEGKTPVAEPDAVQAYLRDLGTSDWRASLGAADRTPRRREKKPTALVETANNRTRAKPVAEPSPGPKPEKKLEPEPAIRPAQASDAEALVGLIAQLGHEVDSPGIRQRLEMLKKAGEPPLVATMDKEVIGLCGLHVMTVIHRLAPVGRITILVVAKRHQGGGIGRRLMEAAEQRLREAGCCLLEVTSHDRLTRAHAFYRHLGFERTSMRFARPIGEAKSL